MLQEKYLPICHFSEKHSILISEKPSRIWPVITEGDLSGSWIIRVLFALRGLRARTTFSRLEETRFILLEQQEQQELIIGLIGQFWKADGNLQVFLPGNFIDWSEAGFLKGTWNFRLIPFAGGTRLETETRVYCTDDEAYRKFKRYWFFIRPFSNLIRKEILRRIKKRSENPHR
jgi:hypothetical protein